MNEKIKEIIIKALKEVSDSNENSININEDMTFIGSKTELDSLDFVKFILELESEINAEFDSELTLLSDKAFSQGSSPYYNIATLTEYISGLLGEEK